MWVFYTQMCFSWDSQKAVKQLISHLFNNQAQFTCNRQSDPHTPPWRCALSTIKHAAHWSNSVRRRLCLSSEPSADSSLPPSSVRAGLPAPPEIHSAFGCLTVLSWKPSLSMIRFISFSARSLVPMSAGFPLPTVLTNWSTFRRTWCCNHSNPISRWRSLPSPTLDAMPFDALLSVAIRTTRSSPKSRAIDCMPIPTLPPLTFPTYSSSPEDNAGTVCVAVWHRMQCPPINVTTHDTLLRSILSPAQSESVKMSIMLVGSWRQYSWTQRPCTFRYRTALFRQFQWPCVGLAIPRANRFAQNCKRWTSSLRYARRITHDLYNVTLDFSSSVSS